MPDFLDRRVPSKGYLSSILLYLKTSGKSGLEGRKAEFLKVEAFLAASPFILSVRIHVTNHLKRNKIPQITQSKYTRLAKSSQNTRNTGHQGGLYLLFGSRALSSSSAPIVQKHRFLKVKPRRERRAHGGLPVESISPWLRIATICS